ncbi:MAG: flippase-like domain-containing protein [Crocinitomicaceae bacterium]|nr:flippase-like domain-containing protein [Crocinitomicaceae bacterium]
MKSPLNKAFSGWKIVLAISLGLFVSGWMLHRSLSKPHYQYSEIGTHSWIDSNQNGLVDHNDPDEFILDKNGKYVEETLASTLQNIDWNSTVLFWLFIAILAMISRDLFYIIRIRILTKNKLSWKASTYVILLWEFASALSPGVVGGSAVAMFILNRETVPFGRATAIVIITAFMDNLFFVLLIPFVFLFIDTATLFPDTEGASLALSWWFWVGFGVIFSICSLLYLTLFWFPKLASRFLSFIFRFPLIQRWRFIAVEWGKEIERASKEFQLEPFLFWLKTFGSTFFSWISRYFVINAILNAFLDLGFVDNIIVLGKQLVLWLFMLVSPTPGGSGVAEYAFGELLASFSSSMILLTALAIIWRLISYFPYLFIGAIVLPAWIRRTSS